jgi:phosphatidylserine decarboxylase
MRIAIEGLPFIAGGVLLAAAGYFIPHRGASLSVVGLGALLAVLCAYFFRDPERPLPEDFTKIYSPGDGRVLSAAQEGPGGALVVRIFLSILDVHVQRLPCSGLVEEVRRIPGSFRMAMEEGARSNERCLVRIRPEGRMEPVEVEQIAGFVARRIVCRVRPGDKGAAGERYGLIRFGSQAALRLPPCVEILVKPGDRVRAGITPVAHWKDAVQ